MLNQYRKNKALSLMAGVGLLGTMLVASMPTKQPTHSVIVQGTHVAHVTTAVQSVGGKVTHQLKVINAVAAEN